MTTPIGGQGVATLDFSRTLGEAPMGRDTLPHTVSPEEAFRLQMEGFKSSLARLRKTVDGLKAQIAKLQGKTDKGSKLKLAALNARLKSSNAQLKATSDKYNSTQTKYYEATGQYDKLLKGDNRDAFLAIKTLFKSYGLETLASKIYDYVKNGYSGDTISILLQDTPEYKARFAGNDARLKAGLPVLSAGEYLATEASYRQIMESAGLPIGFYDQTSDFVGWIGKNVSPSEIQSRVDLATQATVLAPATYRQALEQMGISSTELTAYFLNPTKALPFLQKSAATAAIGAEALSQGLTFNQSYAEQLAGSGVSAGQAREGYSQIAQEMGTMQSLGTIYGDQWSQTEAEESTFGTSAAAASKKSNLIAKERGAFSGSAGGARSGLGQRGGQK